MYMFFGMITVYAIGIILTLIYNTNLLTTDLLKVINFDATYFNNKSMDLNTYFSESTNSSINLN